MKKLYRYRVIRIAGYVGLIVAVSVTLICAVMLRQYLANEQKAAEDYENFINPKLTLAQAMRWQPTAAWYTRDTSEGPVTGSVRVIFPEGLVSDPEGTKSFGHFFRAGSIGQFSIQGVKVVPYACNLEVYHHAGKPDIAVGSIDKDIPNEILTDGPMLIHVLFKQEQGKMSGINFRCTMLPGITEKDLVAAGLKSFELRFPNKSGNHFDDAEFLKSLAQFPVYYYLDTREFGLPPTPVYREMQLGSVVITKAQVNKDFWVMQGYHL